MIVRILNKAASQDIGASCSLAYLSFTPHFTFIVRIYVISCLIRIFTLTIYLQAAFVDI